MKKRRLVTFVLVVLLCLSACGNSTNNQTSDGSDGNSVNMPISENLNQDSDDSKEVISNDNATELSADEEQTEQITESAEEKADEEDSSAETKTVEQNEIDEKQQETEVSDDISPTPLPTLTPTNTPTPVNVEKAVEKTMYATRALNVRAGSSKNTECIGSVDSGEAVYVISILDNGWAKIKIDSGEAYVYYSYLSESKPVSPTPIPTSSPTPVAVITAFKSNPDNEKSKNSDSGKGSVTPVPTATPIPASTETAKYSSIGDVEVIATEHDIHTYTKLFDQTGLTYYSDNADIVKDHYEAVNELRKSVGEAELTLDPTLCRVASYRAAEIILYNRKMSHYHPGKGETKDAACAFDIIYFFQDGYRYIAENLANKEGIWKLVYSRDELGQEFCDQFAASSVHYANMVNENYTKIGICVYAVEDYILVVQIFG